VTGGGLQQAVDQAREFVETGSPEAVAEVRLDLELGGRGIMQGGKAGA
jgi:hypothetical protein